MKRIALGLFIGSLIAYLVFGEIIPNQTRYRKTVDSLQTENVLLKDSITRLITFSEDNLSDLIDYYNIRYKDEVIAQIILETGHLSSLAYKSNNNLFGMKHPGVRPTTSIKDSSGYAYYSGWLESLKDYKIYQTIYCNETFSEFITKMRYSEDSMYLKKIYAIISDRGRQKD